jgi:hypothetical protein
MCEVQGAKCEVQSTNKSGTQHATSGNCSQVQARER